MNFRMFCTGAGEDAFISIQRNTDHTRIYQCYPAHAFPCQVLVWAAIREWLIMSGRLASARTRESFSIPARKPEAEKVFNKREILLKT